MAAGDETVLDLDHKDYAYVGAEADKWTLTKGPAGDCRIAISLVANDPSSVAGKPGRHMLTGAIWQSCNDAASPVHVYVRGKGIATLQEGV